ncbi:hypothetical protein [Ottowia sp.]|uniref:hypothetical protein n=1 Tax=Ottowia sp. TaxID=1898956 RepID=UPI0025CCC847|nr:hypothetical protein [Ottowia sp.]MBK6616634.1 hypothetical protein [Ottowia sp.]
MLAFVIAEGSGADGVEMLYRVGARVQEDHVRSATNLIESLKQRLEGSPGDRLADLLLDLDRLVMLEQQLDSMRLEVPEELRINGQTVLRGQVVGDNYLGRSTTTILAG